MAVETPTDIGTLIVRSARKGNGRPRLHPSGVSVRCIVGLHSEGLSPNDIVAEMPHVSMAEVYAALSYYCANRHEIDTDIQEELEFHDEMVRRARAGQLPVA